MEYAIAITLVLLLAVLIQGVVNSSRMKQIEMKMRGDSYTKKATRR